MSAGSSMPANSAIAPAQEATARQAERFLFQEAWLLDHFDFDAWLRRAKIGADLGCLYHDGPCMHRNTAP